RTPLHAPLGRAERPELHRGRRARARRRGGVPPRRGARLQPPRRLDRDRRAGEDARGGVAQGDGADHARGAADTLSRGARRRSLPEGPGPDAPDLARRRYQEDARRVRAAPGRGAARRARACVSSYPVRPATATDADAICRIYNQGIEDRVATLETELRTPEERRRWLANRSPRHPVVVAEATEPRFVGGHGGGETEPGRTFGKPPTDAAGLAAP